MNSIDWPILISVRPKFSNLIMQGKKTVELRKRVPNNIIGKKIYIYSTLPCGKIIGYFFAKNVDYLPLNILWRKVNIFAGISEEDFFSYYSDKKSGYAIYFDNFFRLKSDISLYTLRKTYPQFTPPQNYCFVNYDILR